jgi:hypothetical protein
VGARASRRAESITTAAIEGFVAERRGTVSATTVNKELQTIS